jgi:hypothetical protein
MSLIASFYLVKNEDIPLLKDLAREPVGYGSHKFLWFKFSDRNWHDPYYQFLHDETPTSNEFSCPGLTMVGVEYFFESLSLRLSDFAHKELSDHFSKTRQSETLLFQKDGISRLKEAISKLDLNPAVVEAFLADSLEFTEMPPEYLLDGIDLLQGWLEVVDDQHFGLYHIG